MAKKVFKMEKWLKWAKDIGMTEDAIKLQVDTWVHAFDNTPPELAKKQGHLILDSWVSDGTEKDVQKIDRLDIVDKLVEIGMVNLPGNFKLGLQNIRELCHLTVCIEFLAKYSDDEHVLVTSEENLIKVNDFLKKLQKEIEDFTQEVPLVNSTDEFQ